MLLCSMTFVSAQETEEPAKAVTPKFTAEGTDEASAEWYYLEWDNCKLVLSEGKDGAATLDDPTEDKEGSQLFKLVGDMDEGFRLINKDNKVLFLNYDSDNEDNSRWKLVDIAEAGDQYTGLVAGTSDTWEIFAYGTNTSKCVNTWGGSGVGCALGMWDKGDKNNQMRFKKADEVNIIKRPKIDFETYYYIQFNEGNAVLESRGNGRDVITARPKNKDSQLWKVVGSKLGEVEIVCKEGNVHLKFANGRLKSTTENGDLRIIGSTNADHKLSYVIAFNTTVAYDLLNSASQENVGPGSFIGLAHHDNKNNALNFVLPKDMKIVEPEMPIFSSSENGNVWYRIVFANHPNKTKLNDKGETTFDKDLDQNFDVALAYAPARKVTIKKTETTGEGENAKTTVTEVEEDRPEGLIVAPVDANSEDQLFRIVGTPEKFEIYSKNGLRIASDEGSKFIFTNMRKGRFFLREAVKFADAWEISRPEAENKALNIDGGLRDFLFMTGNPKHERLVGEWNFGDSNNAVRFEKISEDAFTPEPALDPSYTEPQEPEYVDPVISSEENGDVFYYIQFEKNKDVLTIAEDGTTIQAHPIDESKKDKQLFRLVGSYEKLELLSKGNIRVVYEGDRFKLKNDAETYLTLVELSTPKHAWELTPEGDSQGMNLWYGHGDEMIGKYYHNNDGNVLRFIEAEKRAFTAKPKLEKPKMTLTLPGSIVGGDIEFVGFEDGDQVEVDTEVTVKVTPEEGYELDILTVNGVDIKETMKFIVGENNDIICTFKKKENTGTAVETINVADVKVVGRTVTFAKTQHIVVYSLTGVKVLEANAASVVIPENAGQVVVLKANGKVLKLAF